MIYKPEQVFAMWDTWLYFHDGTHYLFYLHKSAPNKWDGMSVATSTDGVHYQEVGPIVSKRDDAEWLGTGSVWKAGERFVLNFSESRDGVQAIFFAVSDDLLHWDRLGDEYRSDPDPQWYDNTKTGRWDCIWSLPKPDGTGFYGYLTARPWNKTPGIRFDSVGMVESDDGLRWRNHVPPKFEWGDWPQMNIGEVGAIEKVGNQYFLMLGYGEYLLGNRWAAKDLQDTRPGMYTFVSEQPEGPFRPDTEAYRLLVSNGTYFARFYRTPDELLINHHSIEQWRTSIDHVWMAPLKKARVTEDGHMHLAYWRGNESLQGTEIAISLSQAKQCYPVVTPGKWKATDKLLEVDEPASGGVTLMREKFDIDRGIMLEGDISIFPSDRPWAGIGFYVEHEGESTNMFGNARVSGGTGILTQTRGRTEIGKMGSPSSGAFVPLHRFDTGIEPGKRHGFKLLFRRTMLEFYLDEMLVFCHSIEEKASGRLALIHEAGKAIFENIRAWEMSV